MFMSSYRSSSVNTVRDMAFRTRLAATAILFILATLVYTVAAHAGAIGGAIRGLGHAVAARSGYFYDITFIGGEAAQVAVEANGEVDVYVYDSAGRLIIAETDPGNIGVVTFLPRFTQTCRVVVQNREFRTLTYNIGTN